MDAKDGLVLVTGATGLLGQWLVQTAPPGVGIVAVTHRRPLASVPSVQADLRDEASTRAAVDEVRPSLVIHAGYAKDRSSIVDATSNVASAAAAVGAPVMFTSTDAVFSGNGLHRNEASTPDPVSDYGYWKASAEQIVVTASAANSVIRLPLLMSIDPDDPAVAKIRRCASTGDASHWYNDEVRQPALASEVAAALWRIAALSPSERAGFWHLTGPQSMSRFELAEWIVARLGVPRSTIESVPQPHGSSRPRILKLATARAQAHVNWRPTELH